VTSRRAFLSTLAGGLVAVPRRANAQQPVMPVIGFLNAGSPAQYAAYVTAFRRGLTETGYLEGRNVAIEYRWAEGRYERMPELVDDLVRHQVAVIAVTASTAAAQAAKSATVTIPIVFVIGADPLKFGLVASLNRPGANVTGVSFLGNLLIAKQLEMMHEMMPTTAIIGFLVNPGNPNAESDTGNARRAADTLGHRLLVLSATTTDDIDRAFSLLRRQHAGGLLVSPDPLFGDHRDRIAALATRHTMPTIYHSREYALAGGLLSYGPDQGDAYHQAGMYVGRILKGAKPADLPVVQPTKFELVINLKTAKTLGLTIPPSVLARADEVIE
jgi:putative tryptophan/tyrosine transport system substrate-binding protein